MKLRVGVWTILLCVVLCPAVMAFTVSDIANGWAWWGENGAVLATDTGVRWYR